ncbi:MAG TPA: hypothetical protein VFF69_05545 [Phycisphaerales bacterium]|nr:hypothetical protein [Phycisphaerales bacterium]
MCKFVSRIASIATLTTAAGAGLAQGTLTYFWDVNGTGSNTATIGPGETVSLRLLAAWDGPGSGFAGSIYDILGIENWDTGTVTRYDNLLDELTGDGNLQPNNDILGIESFQLPPAFNPNFDRSNPIAIYEIDWTPDDYTARTVRLTDANHLNDTIYTDDFGTSIEFDRNPSEGATIHIIPAPGVLAFAPIGLLACRRRR